MSGVSVRGASTAPKPSQADLPSNVEVEKHHAGTEVRGVADVDLAPSTTVGGRFEVTDYVRHRLRPLQPAVQHSCEPVFHVHPVQPSHVRLDHSVGVEVEHPGHCRQVLMQAKAGPRDGFCGDVMLPLPCIPSDREHHRVKTVWVNHYPGHLWNCAQGGLEALQ
eukprot:CAMPEP_0171119340 /NCGR_PEP_ID=MMETSP0766_2-20121228/97020_1 /TAXON_ID=439317 /ORGANISM="Gambierdiscus australes, Strain CAWD 149" /LENGTH=163 /DNA_ID=CAMNT_0011582003 /DNA_START=351 /DNA_END=840 /DNA_ORIENTATION=+